MTSTRPDPPVVHRRSDARAGLYVHVPFCARICPYCDFAVTSVRQIPHEDYAKALLEEWDARKSSLEGRAVRSIYFGGGTPSRWSPDVLASVLKVWRQELGESVQEVTLECNPMDVTPEHIKVWTEAGVNRVSLGCQSFQPEVLAFLGRNHSAEQAMSAASAWLERDVALSVDLIYGSPMQSAQMWRRDLEALEQLCARGLEHVSSYHLTIEEGTPFARRLGRGEFEERGEEAVWEMVEALRHTLARVGVRPYEVSSWSAPGQESVHNSSYWMGAEYLGLGMGAHSLRIDERGVFRRQNARTLGRYLANPTGEFVGEEVSWQDHLDERLFVGVRSCFGVEVEEVRAQFGLSVAQLRRLEQKAGALREAGLLEGDVNRLVPTWEGMQVADMMGERLVGV